MISAKQKKILAFSYSDYDAIICDGAVRSGKTSIMTVAFIDWAMRCFNNKYFGICGKTVDSATKNIIVPYISMSYAKQKYILRWRRSDKILEVRCGTSKNYFEVFGGKDESSFMLIQGRTFAGILLDEVALMPESFVNQAIARCSVDGAKLWFSCNPANPRHWFYTEWIQKHDERNALYLRFQMKDNPSLSEKVLNDYKTRYSGVFYDRYIRGLWVAAEGLVYNFENHNITNEIPDNGRYFISVDYGTLNPFSAGLWCVTPEKAVRISEYYYNGREKKRQKTDEEYYDELLKLAGNKQIERVVVDPSAASFITLVHHKQKFAVAKADNDVLDGIRTVARYLQIGKIQIHKSCENSIEEFGLYCWDDDSPDDRVIKENDHAMDDIRYFAMTILRRIYR